MKSCDSWDLFQNSQGKGMDGEINRAELVMGLRFLVLDGYLGIHYTFYLLLSIFEVLYNKALKISISWLQCL